MFSLKGSPGRADGYYAFQIPSGWQSRSTRASAWGSDIQELAWPVTSLVQLPKKPSRWGMRKLEKLSFRAVRHRSRWRRGTAYGVIYTPGEDRFMAHIFGHSGGRGRWVRLGAVPMDRPRVSKGRGIAAVFLAPIALLGDAASGNDSGSAPSPGEIQLMTHRSIQELEAPSARLRRRAVKKVGKAGVPALRRALADEDESVRLEAALTLVRLCPEDPDYCREALPTLLRASSHRSGRIRRAVRSALKRIGQSDQG